MTTMRIRRITTFRLSKRHLAVTLVAVFAAVLPLTSPATAASTPAPTATAQHYTGMLASGATWVADVPANYNGTILLFSHGYGPLIAQNQPRYAGDALAREGYAVLGSSYSGNTWWALKNAVNDQFGALEALQAIIGKAKQTYAIGESMGGLVSSLENERNRGQIDGVLTTCGLVAGGVNLGNYQLDGEYALNQLLEPETDIKLVDFADPAEAATSAAALTAMAQRHSATPQGRARITLAAALLNAPTWLSGPTEPAPEDYAAQQAQQVQLLTTGLFNFIVTGRQQIELSAGGNTSFTVGVKYRSRLRDSGYLKLVKASYRAAGLNLRDDLAKLERNADISPDLGAIASLKASSHATGRLTVPQLNIHNINDQLVPVQQEKWYSEQVAKAGSGRLLRQAYSESPGHCNFTSGELIVSLKALIHRVRSGHWDNRADPAALNAAAAAGGYGPTAFVTYQPARLGGARVYPKPWLVRTQS
jgi:hypothetical protein